MDDVSGSDEHRLRAEVGRHLGLWFYVLAHPEDATKAAKKALGITDFEVVSSDHLGPEAPAAAAVGSEA